jgi:hypothetical protein
MKISPQILGAVRKKFDIDRGVIHADPDSDNEGGDFAGDQGEKIRA